MPGTRGCHPAVVLVVSVLAFSCSQEPRRDDGPHVAAPEATSREQSTVVTNDTVVALAAAGIDDASIIRRIHDAEQASFDPTVKGALRLQEAGLSEDVIAAIFNRWYRDLPPGSWVRGPRDREAAIRRLVELGPHAVPLVVEELSHSNPRVREGCCEVLGRIGDAVALEPLRGLLADEDRKVRQAAARGLAQIKERQVER